MCNKLHSRWHCHVAVIQEEKAKKKSLL